MLAFALDDSLPLIRCDHSYWRTMECEQLNGPCFCLPEYRYGLSLENEPVSTKALQLHSHSFESAQELVARYGARYLVDDLLSQGATALAPPASRIRPPAEFSFLKYASGRTDDNGCQLVSAWHRVTVFHSANAHDRWWLRLKLWWKATGVYAIPNSLLIWYQHITHRSRKRGH